MQIGRMDRQATLQQRSLGAASERGAKPQSFATLATVWCERMDVTGREFLASGQPHAEGTAKFRIWYRADVTAINRIVCEGVTWDVLHVAELGRRERLELICRRLA